jgi:hypothetical protein
VACGTNRYILGTIVSNTVTATATEFTSWTAQFGNPIAPQWGGSPSVYTAPETGWYRVDLAASFGATNVRTVIGLKKNGVDVGEAIDITPSQYANVGAGYVLYLTAGDTLRPWVSYANGATSVQCYFSCMMIGK